MRPQDLLGYLKPATFRPFRITRNSGRTFDVGPPEVIKVTRTTALVFDADAEGIVSRYETVSLVLIETVQHLEAEPAGPQGNGKSSA